MATALACPGAVIVSEGGFRGVREALTLWDQESVGDSDSAFTAAFDPPWSSDRGHPAKQRPNANSVVIG